MKKVSFSIGLATAATVIIVAAVVIGAGVAYYAATRTPTAQKAMPATSTQVGGSAPMPQGALGGEDNMMPEQNDTMMDYSGTRLAGDSAPLLDFTKADFDAALASDKLVVLYFYANWCPICREEFPKMEGAFNELRNDDVVGFRVNFNDSDTDDNEVALAREHGVAYQHTKVFIKDGKQTLKSPESWEKDRYLSEINNAI